MVSETGRQIASNRRLLTTESAPPACALHTAPGQPPWTRSSGGWPTACTRCRRCSACTPGCCYASPACTCSGNHLAHMRRHASFRHWLCDHAFSTHQRPAGSGCMSGCAMRLRQAITSWQQSSSVSAGIASMSTPSGSRKYTCADDKSSTWNLRHREGSSDTRQCCRNPGRPY